MQLNEYQKKALVFDAFKNKDHDVTSLAFITKILGLVGESGEVADKIKKIYRDSESQLSDEQKLEIAKELGDVLWYIALIAHYLDTDLQVIADANIEKLQSRLERGKISGSGDNR